MMRAPVIALVLSCAWHSTAIGWEAPRLDAQAVEQQARDRAREAALRSALAGAQRELRQLKSTIGGQDRETTRMEQTLLELQQRAQRQRDTLINQRGSVADLHTVARQAAGDLATALRHGATAPPAGDLDSVLRELSSKPRPVSMDDLATLWESLHATLTHSATRSQQELEVQVAPATLQTRTVLRIGSALALADGEPLRYDAIAGVYRVVPISRRLPAAPSGIGDGKNTVAARIVIGDRVAPRQGPVATLRRAGPIGAVIGLLGIAGAALLLARLRLVVRTRAAERRQAVDRPTARLKTAQSELADIDDHEGRINAAAGREVRRLQWGSAALQVIIAAAPLLGLLGTVTGMIMMFNQLRLYGSSDPVLMADGIAQALATTWLGLLVALPLLLGHRWVAAMADTLIVELDRTAIGLVADSRSGG